MSTSDAATSSQWAGQADPPDPRRWIALIVMMIAAFMDLVDVTVVNIALPAIRTDLGATYSASQWITGGYTLMFGLFLIVGGRLGDRYGRKAVFLAGTVGFTVASALCGIAPNPTFLVAARLIQGVATALMIPQILATVYATFPPKERAGASGAYGGVTGLAAVVGPLMAGLLIGNDVLGLGWRSVFLINIPIGVIAFVLALVYVKDSKSWQPPRMDLLGALIITVAMFLLLFPLVQGREQGWPAWMVVALVASPFVVAAYVAHARSAARRGADPLVPLRLFGQPGFSLAMLALLLFDAVMISFSLVLSVTLQTGLGLGPFATGLLYLPWAIGGGIAATLAQNLVPKLGGRLVAIGAIIKAGGVFWLAAVLAVDTTAWYLLAPSLLLVGFGMGLVLGTAFTVGGATVEARDAGAASGALTASLQVGGAIGIALLSVLFFNVLAGSASAAYDQEGPALRSGLVAAGVPAESADATLTGLRSCFVDRSAALDPTAVPASCQSAAVPGGPNSPALADAFGRARAETFLAGLRHYSWWAIGGLVLVALLALGLPRSIAGDAEGWGEGDWSAEGAGPAKSTGGTS
jgi:EmrB/QacA subfamily drug resistance transporter